MNLIVGENGCGKTTLLEAAYIMAHGRSFRQARDPQLVQWGEKRFHVSGRWTRFGPLYVNVEGSRGRTSISLQGKPVRTRKDLEETLPVLVDAPQSRKVVDGVPNERRRWLDGMMTACSDTAAAHYRNYLRCLMQRSRLLRSGSRSSIDIWEAQLVSHGMAIVAERRRLIDALNNHLAGEESLVEGPFRLELPSSAPDEQETWLAALHASRAEDARFGRLRIGPHCDRLKMIYHDREIRSSGSRGQQRLAGMALLLAESELRVQHRGLIPVLLLDDCLEALDRSRQHRLLARMEKSRAQILMTAPNTMSLPKGADIEVQVHELKRGPQQSEQTYIPEAEEAI